ncbi:MAG: tRNA (N6-isopentenyl adenosine(37)-C2)-methylthiotransferase MiaB [Calditrichaeota bacterium]|nr:tRNA (N6-isopentenyl adenosine(37)-C2)-methylthiotransferase MiaB [Calditrichota bacterium]
MKKVYIETYGCQMNEYDTELVKTILGKEEDYQFIDSPDEAEIILLNTCSVRDNANRKVFNRIHQIKQKRNGDKVLIGILGCMATNFRQQLLKDPHLPIDFIAGPDSYKRLPQLIRRVETTGEKSFDVTLSEFETYSDVYPTREGGVNAWIAVMRGCDNFCTFCVVPYTRGRERSRDPENVVAEVRRLAEEGFRQVTLLGQNVNSYNYQGKDFAYLLERVSEVDGIERIRFTSPHPKDFPDSLLRVIAENPKVCRQIHLPLQAGNDRILALMNRTYTRAEFLKLVEKIRRLMPDVVLTTDIIVGFPTETDEEFEDTVRVVETVQFDSAFIFKYSERPKTIAARKYPDDVQDEVKTERIVRLNEIQKKISYQKNCAHVGEVHEVLIEQEFTKKSPNHFQGRNEGNKIVIFPRGDYRKGQFVRVKILEATPHALRGEVVEVLEK